MTGIWILYDNRKTLAFFSGFNLDGKKVVGTYGTPNPPMGMPQVNLKKCATEQDAQGIFNSLVSLVRAGQDSPFFEMPGD